METGTFSAIARTLAARSLIYVTLILATISLLSCKIDTTVDPSEYFTETFSGTLLPNGGTFHSFTVDQAGEVQITAVSLVPAATIGLAAGTESSGSCSLTDQDDSIQLGELFSLELNAGARCVQVYDPGSLSEPVAYTIQVYHP
jgi:hypothetical protein